MALAISGVFVGCHEEEFGTPFIEQKKALFEETFVKAFGQPDPTHNWGFRMRGDESNVVTRTVHKKDPSQGFDYEHEPDPVTAKEAAFVYKWFQENSGLTDRGKDWSSFYLQHVYGTMNLEKKGMWNKYDENIVKRGEGDGWSGDQEFTSTAGMDYLILSNNNGYEEHVKDFNAEEGGPKGIVYMTNSSALYFGYHSTWDDSRRLLFKLAKIVVPGECFGPGEADREGWYVGLSLYGEKWNNGKEGDSYKNQRIGVQRYNYGDDWILKVVPGEGSSQTAPDVWEIGEIKNPEPRYVVEGKKVVESGRVMCEDLAGATGKFHDMDYNDVVFDAVIVNEYKKLVTKDGDDIEDYSFGYNKTYAKVRLMAAGGTIPVELTIKDKYGKKYTFDVHETFDNTPDNWMINTLPIPEDSEEEYNSYLGGATVVSRDPVTLTDDNGSEEFDDVEYISDITLNVLYENVSTELKAVSGGATYMFLVPLGVKWARERSSFGDDYPYFSEWVHNKDYNSTWYDANIPEFLYDEGLVGLAEPDEYETGPTFYDNNGGSSSASKTKQTSYSPVAFPNTISETVLFDYTKDGPGYLCPEITTADGYQEEEYVSIPGSAAIKENDVIRIYGVYLDDWYIETNFSSDKITSDDGKGYIDIPVTSEYIGDINKTNRSINITGKHFTVTYITVHSGGSAGGGAKPGQIWPDPSLGAGGQGTISLAASLFPASASDKKLCIYASSVGNYIQFHLGSWADFSQLNGFTAPTGWEIHGQLLKPKSGTFVNGRYEMPLSTVLSLIRSKNGKGCGIQSDYTITNITIE